MDDHTATLFLAIGSLLGFMVIVKRLQPRIVHELTAPDEGDRRLAKLSLMLILGMLVVFCAKGTLGSVLAGEVVNALLGVILIRSIVAGWLQANRTFHLLEALGG